MTFNFLELFNAIGAAQKVATNDFIPAESLETPITEYVTNLDSLERFMASPKMRSVTILGPTKALDYYKSLSKSTKPKTQKTSLTRLNHLRRS